MQNNNAKNCWEYWDCDPMAREECPAYRLNMGKECWVVASSFTNYPYRGGAFNGARNCWECPWFKKTSNVCGELE